MTIRQMQQSDLEFAWACIHSVGWDGEDAAALKSLFEYDPRGCFLLEYHGKPVGMCIAIQYSHSAFIGDLIVADAYRGRGFGTKLFDHAVNYLDSCGPKSIYLDAALKAVPIYERSDF